MSEFIKHHPESAAAVKGGKKELTPGDSGILTYADQFLIGASIEEDTGKVRPPRNFFEKGNTMDQSHEMLIPEGLRGNLTSEGLASVNKKRRNKIYRGALPIFNDETLAKFAQCRVNPQIELGPVDLRNGAQIWKLNLIDRLTDRKINSPKQLSAILPTLGVQEPFNNRYSIVVTEEKEIFVVFDSGLAQTRAA
jgi:hypothetical protein